MLYLHTLRLFEQRKCKLYSSFAGPAAPAKLSSLVFAGPAQRQGRKVGRQVGRESSGWRGRDCRAAVPRRDAPSRSCPFFSVFWCYKHRELKFILTIAQLATNGTRTLKTSMICPVLSAILSVFVSSFEMEEAWLRYYPFKF